MGIARKQAVCVFWKVESDFIVAKVLGELLQLCGPEDGALAEREDVMLYCECQKIVERLKANPTYTDAIEQAKSIAVYLNAEFITNQCNRMQGALAKNDPELAIGSAKEFVESVSKAIIFECKITLDTKKPDLRNLVKVCLRDLGLVPDSISEMAKVAETVKRLLNNLSTIIDGLDELRNHYGTGHG